MRMTHEDLAELDRRHLWHPFTQQQGWMEEDFPIIERADETTLYDTEGNAYIDGVSSLWCNVHGHRHPAIDIALKMAYQWHHQRGEWWRAGFVCLRNSYHGDTLGSVSVGGIELFHSLYRPLLFDVWQAEPGDVESMRALLAEHADRCAAVIVEPLVQGAAGIHVQPEGYLRAVRELCDEFGVFLICDEVATGFGRTGTMFACEHEGVAPDFMCVAKGLTGGYLPLGGAHTTQRV